MKLCTCGYFHVIVVEGNPPPTTHPASHVTGSTRGLYADSRFFFVVAKGNSLHECFLLPSACPVS